MNKWSRRRKRIITSLVFIGFILVVALPAYYLLYEPPTCFDKSQNKDETGIDCGGSCQLLCTSDSLPLIIHGDPQVLKVTGNSYEVVALFENPNANAEIYRAKYFIRLYSAQSIAPIKLIEGETFVPRGATFAIFEGPFNSSDGAIPIRATLEWQEASLEWKKTATVLPNLRVENSILTQEVANPRLEARIENTSLNTLSNIDVVALIYNDKGSIFAASKTFIDHLRAGEGAPAVFSWPESFVEEAVNIEIITRVLPDRSFIK